VIVFKNLQLFANTLSRLLFYKRVSKNVFSGMEVSRKNATESLLTFASMKIRWYCKLCIVMIHQILNSRLHSKHLSHLGTYKVDVEVEVKVALLKL
jgi:hypothetical protein